jgi:hypothetical protein
MVPLHRIHIMRNVAALAFFTLLSLAAATVSADTAYVVPANPTPADPVTLVIQSNSDCTFQGVTQIGNLFQIHVGICPFEPPVINVPLGNLPQGTYQYEIYEGPGTTTLRASGSFVVTLVGVPTLSTGRLAALLVCLAAAGFFMSRRT